MADFHRRATALIVSLAISFTAGCASTGAARVATVTPDATASRAVLAEFVQGLPAGAAVRVDRASGRSVRGTLLKATPDRLFVQPRTRLPEAMIEIPMTDVLSVTPETRGGNSHIGRAIGVGAAAGAGAALAVFLVILATVSD